AADVRRDDHAIAGGIVGLHVAGDDRNGIKIVGRDIEEALDLTGVKVKRQDAVGAGFGDEVGDELGRDRRARTGLAVLTGIAEIGQDGGDATGRGTAEGIDHDEQFHQVIVCRIGGRLQNEYVFAAHVFLILYEDFLIGEAAHAGLTERNVEILSNGFGK